jgi:hypothetical protein
MARKHKPEEIIGKLREAEIVLGRAERLPMRVAGSASPNKATTAGARSMAA